MQRLKALRDRECKTNVLVVDDNFEVLHFFDLTLSHEGYGVQVAQGGEAGIRAYRAHRPDVMLLDVDMPDISGLEALRIIKGMDGRRQCPVIMLTGLNDHRLLKKAMDMGAYGFISKPFNINYLNKLLRQAVGDQRRKQQELHENVGYLTEENYDPTEPIKTKRAS